MGFNSSRDGAFKLAVLSNLHKVVDSTIASGFTLAGDILFQNGYMKEKRVRKTNNDLINAAAAVFKYNLYIVLILTIPVLFILPHIQIHNYGKVFAWGVIMQGIAMTLVNYSSINLSANYLGLFGYTEIFWSFFYGYTILKQRIDTGTVNYFV